MAGFTDVAVTLARRIAASAVWSGERCNWLGARAVVSGHRGVRAVRSALGSDLYAGTSGVALFLAEVAAHCEDRALRSAALGAARHAQHHVRDIPPERSDGLYEGPIGVAWATARVGARLDDEAVLDGARDVLDDWRPGAGESSSFDLMYGLAGAVAGLVALTDTFEDPWLLATAEQLGSRLLEAAQDADGGRSWPAQRGQHNLCGFSHGTAGIGYALRQLHGVTGGERWRHGAEDAFAYERSWFERRGGSWPDLRGVDGRSGCDAAPPAPSTWCNGVCGIAAARLPIGRDGDGAIGVAEREDLRIALAAMRDVARALSSAGTADFSLCHGAAGIGDVLVCAGEHEAATEIGRMGIALYHGSDTSFPCGVRDGSTPALLLGVAGIGLFYLRLVDPGVPSALLVGRSREIDAPWSAT